MGGAQFRGRKLVYVAGNHEYYGEKIHPAHQELRNDAQELGVHFLENEALVVGDVALLGLHAVDRFRPARERAGCRLRSRAALD